MRKKVIVVGLACLVLLLASSPIWRYAYYERGGSARLLRIDRLRGTRQCLVVRGGEIVRAGHMRRPDVVQDAAARGFITRLQTGRQKFAALSPDEQELVRTWMVYNAPDEWRKALNVPSIEEWEKVPPPERAPTYTAWGDC